jgi:hypothetical protein
MEIQEPVLRSVDLILGWDASPRYADYRGQLTEQLRELLGQESDWSWDGPITAVTNDDLGIDVSLSPTELLVISERTEPDLGSVPEQAASIVLEQLSIARTTFLGAASTWLSAVSSTKELTAWLGGELGRLGRTQLYEALGARPTSYVVQAQVEHDDFLHSVELKPMTGSEAAEGDDFMGDEEDDFPPASLFLEVRRSKAAELDAKDGVQLFNENLDKNLAAAEQFDVALREDL